MYKESISLQKIEHVFRKAVAGGNHSPKRLARFARKAHRWGDKVGKGRSLQKLDALDQKEVTFQSSKELLKDAIRTWYQGNKGGPQLKFPKIDINAANEHAGSASVNSIKLQKASPSIAAHELGHVLDWRDYLIKHPTKPKYRAFLDKWEGEGSVPVKKLIAETQAWRHGKRFLKNTSAFKELPEDTRKSVLDSFKGISRNSLNAYKADSLYGRLQSLAKPKAGLEREVWYSYRPR